VIAFAPCLNASSRADGQIEGLAARGVRRGFRDGEMRPRIVFIVRRKPTTCRRDSTVIMAHIMASFRRM
jgi:hypothetical protein